ncbi:MAG: DUF305 domain-containing protein [Actinomycetota bacterium]
MRTDTRSKSGHGSREMDSPWKPYLIFGGMILTAIVAMYALTYVNTYAASHIEWSETRVYMSIVMGGAMIIIMLGYMWDMYDRLAVNLGLIGLAALMIAAGTVLVRTQATVQDSSYMSAMIPHHSIAILTSENSEISDVRVCQLAEGIIKAQNREIAEMQWLIDDIKENGPADTPEEAAARPVPEFPGTSIRTCPVIPTTG